MPVLGLCLDYDTEVPSLKAIMRASKRTQWVVEDVDWQAPLKDGDYFRILDWHGVYRSEYVRGLPKKKLRQLAQQIVAFEFSQILHGEQGAMMLAGQLTNAVEDLDARLFAATQVRDEARHVEAVRGIVERIGPIYPCGADLSSTLEQLLRFDLWTKQVLGLQLFLEARALLSFRQHLLFVDDPVFKDAVLRIERDEAQHVAFGVRYMERGVEHLDKAERNELLEFAVWLDQNVWRMTRSEEFAQAFEECDLDYAKAVATWSVAPRFNLRMKAHERRTVEHMLSQFRKWFTGRCNAPGCSRTTKIIQRSSS